ncbi:SMC-Scp complex subunit ScpB [Candidatus Zixiibacteriota bacterium]
MDENIEKSLRNALEVILFSVSEPISSYQVGRILEEGGWTSNGESITPGQVEKYIELLVSNWETEGRPLTVLKIVGGFQMATRPEWVELVAKLQEDKRSHRLSRASLETLAIVAYRQPVIRPDIDAIRGVSSDSALKTLLERGLVAIAGRDEGPGRPLLYKTTSAFLKYFGLNRVEDLPDPDELIAILGLNERPQVGLEEGEVPPESALQAEFVLPHPVIEPLPDVDTLDIHEEEHGDMEEPFPPIEAFRDAEETESLPAGDDSSSDDDPDSDPALDSDRFTPEA